MPARPVGRSVALVLLVLPFLALPPSAVLAEGPEPLRQGTDVYVYIAPAHYAERQYSPLEYSTADYLYIVGEPIQVRLKLQNRGDHPVVLNTKALSSDEPLELELYRSSEDRWDRVELGLEGQPEGEVVTSSGSDPVSITTGTTLLPHSLLSVAGGLRFNTLPGFYELRVGSIRAGCAPACRFVRQATVFRFEVRAADAKVDRLELFGRQARRAITAGDSVAAGDWIARLVALHPTSVVACQLSAELSEGAQDWRQAETDYRRALDLLRLGQDQLLLSAGDPEHLRSFVGYLETKARHARAAAHKDSSGDSQPEQQRLIQAMRAEAPEWAFQSTTATAGRRVHKWGLDGRQMVVIVRDFDSSLDATADLQQIQNTLSMPTKQLKDVGDRAFVAGVEGGRTNLYATVGRHIVHVSLPASIDRVRRLTAAIIRVVTEDPLALTPAGKF